LRLAVKPTRGSGPSQSASARGRDRACSTSPGVTPRLLAPATRRKSRRCSSRPTADRMMGLLASRSGRLPKPGAGMLCMADGPVRRTRVCALWPDAGPGSAARRRKTCACGNRAGACAPGHWADRSVSRYCSVLARNTGNIWSRIPGSLGRPGGLNLAGCIRSSPSEVNAGSTLAMTASGRPWPGSGIHAKVTRARWDVIRDRGARSL